MYVLYNLSFENLTVWNYWMLVLFLCFLSLRQTLLFKQVGLELSTQLRLTLKVKSLGVRHIPPWLSNDFLKNNKKEVWNKYWKTSSNIKFLITIYVYLKYFLVQPYKLCIIMFLLKTKYWSTLLCFEVSLKISSSLSAAWS